MPHGYCYFWEPLVLWLNVISDALITLSYYCIPIVLIYFVRKNREIPFNRIFWMFGAFILACGTTHLLEVWNIWHANYLLAGAIKAVTAVVSVATVVMIVPLIPKAVTLPASIDLLEANRLLERQIARRDQMDASSSELLRRNIANLSRTTLAVLAVCGLVGAFLLIIQHREYPDLHTVLDTCVFVISALLAVAFWAIGARVERPFAKRVAVSFALTSLSEFAHTLASLEWSHVLQTTAHDLWLWRPATWPPAAHLLPIGIATAAWMMKRGKRGIAGFALGLLALDGLLFSLFYFLPPYAPANWLGITRPTLMLVPLLWIFAGWNCWKLRNEDRMFWPLTLMAAVLSVSSIAILYSRTPHDTFGMVSHLGKTGGYLALLVAIMQLASIDMIGYMRAQRALAQLNEELEHRVIERTTELEAINLSLEKEILARAEEERGRQRLAAIVDSSEDAILSKDLSGKIVTWNRGAEKLYGHTAEEVIGQPSTVIIPTAMHEEEKQVLAEVAAGRQSRRDETTRLRKDGTLIQVAVAISPVRNAEGRIIGASSISHDISERRLMEDALRESQQRLSNILDSAMDAIIAVDEKQRVVLFNVAAEKMFGCMASEAMASTIDRFIPERFRNDHKSHMRNFGNTGVTSRRMGTLDAISGVRANGDEFPVEAAISQVNVGGKKLFTVILRDITYRKQSDERLREQARMLDITTVLVRGMDGRIALWTRGAEQLYGFSAAEAIGQISHELLHTSFPSSLQHMEETLAQTGRWEGELEHRKKDGSTVYVASVQIVYRDERGHAIRVLEANTDITRRKQDEQKLANLAEELSRQTHDLMLTQETLREQGRIFQLVLDSMGEGLIAADEKGAFLLWNPAAEKILGSGPRMIPPESWSTYYGAYLPDGETFVPAEQLPLSRAMKGEGADMEILIRPLGTDRTTWIEVASHPLRDANGEVKGGVIVFRDTTQRKRDEREIRRLNEELEQRVIQRTAELQAANKELEAFTYSVSHDLRAPLRHINGFTRILVEDYGTSLPEEARQHLARIEQGATRMGRLVDELLSLTRVGRQTLSVQVTGLASIVKDVITLLEPEVEGRTVEWQIRNLPFVECDPTLVRQVFQNLLSNALKYSRPRQRTVIEIGQVEKDGTTALFVRDNGVGFSMKYADKLFGVFQRLHRPEDFEGTGVGLATVHRIIQKHGGRIWAEAELDRGATFYFTLGGIGQGQSGSAVKVGGQI